MVGRVAVEGRTRPPDRHLWLHNGYVIVLTAVGHLTLNVHGMAIVVFAHSIWFIGVATQIYGKAPRSTVIAATE